MSSSPAARSPARQRERRTFSTEVSSIIGGTLLSDGACRRGTSCSPRTASVLGHRTSKVWLDDYLARFPASSFYRPSAVTPSPALSVRAFPKDRLATWLATPPLVGAKICTDATRFICIGQSFF